MTAHHGLGRGVTAAGGVVPLLLGLNLGQALFGLALPAFLMGVFDRVLATRSEMTLAWLFAGLAVALVALALIEGLRGLALQLAGTRLGHAVANAAFDASSRLGGAVQPLRDVETLRGFAVSPAAGALLDILWAPLFLLVLAALAPVFALYAIVAAALLLALNLGLARSGRSGFMAANAASAESVVEIGAAVRGAEAVVGLGMLGALIARWQGRQRHALGLVARAVAAAKRADGAARTVRLAAGAGMVALGAVLVIQGSITPGAMIAANLILARTLLPFENAASAARQFADATAAWRRLDQALGLPQERRDRSALPRPAARLVADRLVAIPDGADRPVLRGVSFSLGAGEVLGVIGPSAAGKSTLLRLVMGMAAPTAGSVTLDGYGTALWDRGDLARHVGFLPQHLALADATIAETIARLAVPDHAAVIRAAKLAGLHEAIAALPFGYATPLAAFSLVLSGGQRQRLGLARALYGDPVLVVLDEPDAALDADGEAALSGAIAALRARGAMVVLTSHRRGVIESADKLLVLKQGLVDRYGERTAVLAELGQPPVRLVAAPPARSAIGAAA
ncbi:type I secretion system permease/ATPase [Elioraea sp.]|uniref:type I secretion system permease/ATPase n=1 Tax=Elioraea sp. TaxID=2185103 RepID=UPI0025C19946|nr:ATP-binding cassette domain-containing protein [Elioraea sp.]